MTVYPLVFHIGSFEITGFGFMVMAGFYMAGWAMQRRLTERSLNGQYAWDIVFVAVIGGLLGAKIWYAALYQDPSRLLQRAGLVWYGGLVGGALAVWLLGLRRRIPTRFTADLVAPALAVGYALGRVGCFLVEDDYGIPTDLPWGMKFPAGLPPTTAQNLQAWGVEVPDAAGSFDVLAVHPTQLYEVAAMLFVFWLLWRLRDHRHATGWLFGVYLLLAGTERFFVEFIRAKDDRFLGGFTLAQLASVAAIAIGVTLVVKLREGATVDPTSIDALRTGGT
ncbi:MAG: prolipoprotein diacylglyceryl transferase [Gemmatimonadales bacterium]|jgi:phosphatidylglycerol:prolipoprotein diacylglycerol transferase